MRATIHTDFTNIDSMSNPTYVAIKVENLREGMVVLDPELGTPALGIDHRITAARGSGNVSWFAADLEEGGWTQLNLRKGITVQVIAE